MLDNDALQRGMELKFFVCKNERYGERLLLGILSEI